MLRKKHKKRLFMTSNAHTDYIDIIMNASLGDDWISLFDIVTT